MKSMRTHSKRNIIKIIPLILLAIMLVTPAIVNAQNALPKLTIGLEKTTNPTDLVPTLQILFLLTILSLAPSILIMMTSFTRIMVVFHFLRQSLATQTVPSPIRMFMLKQTREKDLKLFVDLEGGEKPKTPNDISLTTLIPAFIISELKTAFQIGFLLYLPMLLIDLVVGSVLLSMGMMMIPPVMIAMPFKILLFVLVDGWYLIVESLVKGFHL